MISSRIVLLLTGLAVAGVGAVELLQAGTGNLLAAVVWLAGGVLLHDGVLAPVVVGLAVVASGVLPWWTRAPAAAAAVVLGTVTLAVVPVLGRFGARPDNPTLLDRPYGVGWLVFAALVLSCAGVGAARRRRKGGV